MAVRNKSSIGDPKRVFSDIEVRSHLSSSIEQMRTASSIAEVSQCFTHTLGGLLGCSRVLVFRLSSLEQSTHLSEWHTPESSPLPTAILTTLVREFRGKAVKHHGVLQFRAKSDGPKWAKAVQQADASYVLVKALRHLDNPIAVAVLLRDEAQGSWTPGEVSIVKQLARVAGKELSRLSAQSATTQAAGSRERHAEVAMHHRLVEQSGALLFHADTSHHLRYINQRSLEFFGVPPEDFITNGGIPWIDLMHFADRELLHERLKSAEAKLETVEEEVRVVNHISGTQRWVLLRYSPVCTSSGDILGWDGYAHDMTRRREAQQALAMQSKRVRALYSVSSAIRGYFDTVSIASGGLASLCEATGADAAFCFVANSNTEEPRLVAHHGLSEQFIRDFEKTKAIPAVASYVADDGSAAIIEDLRSDPRASSRWENAESLRSAVVVPIRLEDSSLGSIGLFHKSVGHFSSADVMLVSAAANQIGLAARQANLFTAYRKQTRNLAALYRLSHELSGSQSLEQIFNRAFSIIRDEIGVKRLWIGLLNETGTRIIGQGAMGPGWKRRLVEMNVEVVGKDHPIAQVVASRKPRILTNPDEILDEFGVKRFFSRFSFNAIGLIPLVAAGQLLGVLAFQPSSAKRQVQEEEMTLLSSLASEIAAAILAKRFDDRVAEAEKMRTAGLLAAGIAHNFNNLLQAILGQASLLELQQLKQEQILRAAGIINEAAAKGATLVRQLMSFAHLEEPHKDSCAVNHLLKQTAKQLERNIKEGQSIRFSLGKDIATVYADSTQILRIISSLISNASEASSDDAEIEIFSDEISVSREAPHFEVPYGKYVRLGVRDDGKGMDEATRRRCFEPFFTTKDLDPSSGLSMSGAGLGLAAAFALARKNGGRLVVDSRVGHGSVFTLYLPVATAEERAQLVATREQPQLVEESAHVAPPKAHTSPPSVKTEGHDE